MRRQASRCRACTASSARRRSSSTPCRRSSARSAAQVARASPFCPKDSHAESARASPLPLSRIFLLRRILSNQARLVRKERRKKGEKNRPAGSLRAISRTSQSAPRRPFEMPLKFRWFLRVVETVMGEEDRECSGKPRTVRIG